MCLLKTVLLPVVSFRHFQSVCILYGKCTDSLSRYVIQNMQICDTDYVYICEKDFVYICVIDDTTILGLFLGKSII